MKFLTWFVSVLIVVVMCAPCMDSAAAVPMQSASFQASPAQEQAAVKDCCSPFCTCACCSAPTFVQNTSISVEVPELILAEYTQKAFGKAIAAELSVWQPPRLG